MASSGKYNPGFTNVVAELTLISRFNVCGFFWEGRGAKRSFLVEEIKSDHNLVILQQNPILFVP